MDERSTELPSEQSEPPEHRRVRFGWVILTVTIVLVSVFFLGVIAKRSWVKELTGTNVTRAEAPIEGLPVSATHVSYFVSHVADAYEFDVSEADFIGWSTAKQWAVAPLLGNQRSIPRARTLQGRGEPEDAVIRVGDFFYERQDPTNLDHYIWVGFDRRSSRAYYFESYH